MLLTKRHLILTLLISALLVTILMAAGLPNLEFRPGQWNLTGLAEEENSNAMSSPWKLIGDIAASPGILLLLMIPLIILYCIRSPRAIWRLITVCCICLALLLLKDYIPWGKTLQNPNLQGQIAEQAQSLPFAEKITPDPPLWLVLIVSLGLSALILGGALLIWRRLRPEPLPFESVAQEVKKTIDKLHAGANIRDGVIHSYYEMSRVAHEQQGLKRNHSMTTREFESYLEEMGLPGIHVRRLTRLFEKVRYGAKELDEYEEDEAIACLTAIVEACEGLK